MTNKLRSVIEAITKWRDFFPIDFQETVPVMPYENAKQAQVDLLDAIIEYMEDDIELLEDCTLTDYNRGQRIIVRGYLANLKQAREELSTSLTQ